MIDLGLSEVQHLGDRGTYLKVFKPFSTEFKPEHVFS
jgi:hypothetical protein